MLDVVLPVPIHNADLAPDALDLIENYTDIPFRVIVVVDGGMRDDFAALEAHLRGFGSEWMLLHEEEPVYLNGCIRAAIPHLLNPLTAVIRPEVRIADSKWFGKMQQILTKDQLCGVVDTIPNTPSAAQYPVKRAVHRMPDDGCRLALLSSRFLTGTGAPIGAIDPVAFWSRRAIECGGSCWHAGGVLYHLVEHKAHAWHAPLGNPVRSESPSLTTPVSSTPTTTGTDGSEDFDL